MKLDDHAYQVHAQLRAAAALGDERTQQVAEALSGAADAAVRLTIMNALAAATAEINAALSKFAGAPTVALHLEGEELRANVTSLADEQVPALADDGDATARISLRLSERLKGDVEKAAIREAVSVNTWLVRAARSGLTARRAGSRDPTWPARNARRTSGWVSG